MRSGCTFCSARRGKIASSASYSGQLLLGAREPLQPRQAKNCISAASVWPSIRLPSRIIASISLISIALIVRIASNSSGRFDTSSCSPWATNTSCVSFIKPLDDGPKVFMRVHVSAVIPSSSRSSFFADSNGVSPFSMPPVGSSHCHFCVG